MPGRTRTPEGVDALIRAEERRREDAERRETAAATIAAAAWSALPAAERDAALIAWAAQFALNRSPDMVHLVGVPDSQESIPVDGVASTSGSTLPQGWARFGETEIRPFVWLGQSRSPERLGTRIRHCDAPVAVLAWHGAVHVYIPGE